MNVGQLRPTRLAVLHPVVNPLPRIRSGRVCVQAGRLVHHEQVFIFKYQAGQHPPMKSWKHTRTEGWISNEQRQSLALLPERAELESLRSNTSRVGRAWNFPAL